MKLLGHVVNKKEVPVDPDKNQAIGSIRLPETITELRSFLALAGYYRRFIYGFATVSAPLHAQTSGKNQTQ